MNDNEPRYRGDVVNCTRHGKGMYKYPIGGQDMITYSGEWKYGIKVGANGVFNVKGLSQYIGDFKGIFVLLNVRSPLRVSPMHRW